jgi:transcription initiation factor TFIID subunit 6
VQPSIPQNPASSDARHQDLLPKGPGANPYNAAINGHDNVTVKPLIKHILPSESIQLHQRICSALLDETNEEWRMAALTSLRTQQTLPQLVPYFIEFIAEQVTHHLKELFILNSMMAATEALLQNSNIYLAPYVGSLVPPVLTCLVGKRLGPPTGNHPNATAETNGSLHNRNPLAHYDLRNLAASIITTISKQYSKDSQTLKSRLARTLLKHWLDTNKPLGTHYGALKGLLGVVGPNGVRQLILPNLKFYDGTLKEALNDESKKVEVDFVISVIMRGLTELQKVSGTQNHAVNGVLGSSTEDIQQKLADKIGDVLAAKLVQAKNQELMKMVLESSVDL